MIACPSISLVLRRGYIRAKESNLVIKPGEDLIEKIEDSTFVCMTDRKSQVIGSAPLVMGLFISTLALISLIIMTYVHGESNKYDELRA